MADGCSKREEESGAEQTAGRRWVLGRLLLFVLLSSSFSGSSGSSSRCSPGETAGSRSPAPAPRQPRRAPSHPAGHSEGSAPRPKLPRTVGRASSGCSGPAGGAHRNFGEASSGSGSGGGSSNDSLARARCAPGHLEPGGLGRRGVHMLAQPPPGRLLQLRHRDPGQGGGEEAGEGGALWHTGLHHQADEDVPRLHQDAPCAVHPHRSFRESLWP
ncbi:metalloproteinase inhibitor 3 isoform X1 [Nycticebus coucang]|uniref:metalloproteinase inhibitor 3 isoform X1 n=1 Tax=Nycticebus coucang TaxID=9470 RepID=UPI00234D8043|nr:metalloproteinase inhibitor 3 isoform X1 [Nycticebus coucang]